MIIETLGTVCDGSHVEPRSESFAGEQSPRVARVVLIPINFHLNRRDTESRKARNENGTANELHFLQA